MTNLPSFFYNISPSNVANTEREEFICQKNIMTINKQTQTQRCDRNNICSHRHRVTKDLHLCESIVIHILRLCFTE